MYRIFWNTGTTYFAAEVRPKMTAWHGILTKLSPCHTAISSTAVPRKLYMQKRQHIKVLIAPCKYGLTQVRKKSEGNALAVTNVHFLMWLVYIPLKILTCLCVLPVRKSSKRIQVWKVIFLKVYQIRTRRLRWMCQWAQNISSRTTACIPLHSSLIAYTVLFFLNN